MATGPMTIDELKKQIDTYKEGMASTEKEKEMRSKAKKYFDHLKEILNNCISRYNEAIGTREFETLYAKAAIRATFERYIELHKSWAIAVTKNIIEKKVGFYCLILKEYKFQDSSYIFDDVFGMWTDDRNSIYKFLLYISAMCPMMKEGDDMTLWLWHIVAQANASAALGKANRSTEYFERRYVANGTLKIDLPMFEFSCTPYWKDETDQFFQHMISVAKGERVSLEKREWTELFHPDEYKLAAYQNMDDIPLIGGRPYAFHVDGPQHGFIVDERSLVRRFCSNDEEMESEREVIYLTSHQYKLLSARTMNVMWMVRKRKDKGQIFKTAPPTLGLLGTDYTKEDMENTISEHTLKMMGGIRQSLKAGTHAYPIGALKRALEIVWCGLPENAIMSSMPNWLDVLRSIWKTGLIDASGLKYFSAVDGKGDVTAVEKIDVFEYAIIDPCIVALTASVDDGQSHLRGYTERDMGSWSDDELKSYDEGVSDSAEWMIRNAFGRQAIEELALAMDDPLRAVHRRGVSVELISTFWEENYDRVTCNERKSIRVENEESVCAAAKDVFKVVHVSRCIQARETYEKTLRWMSDDFSAFIMNDKHATLAATGLKIEYGVNYWRVSPDAWEKLKQEEWVKLMGIENLLDICKSGQKNDERAAHFEECCKQYSLLMKSTAFAGALKNFRKDGKFPKFYSEPFKKLESEDKEIFDLFLKALQKTDIPIRGLEDISLSNTYYLARIKRKPKDKEDVVMKEPEEEEEEGEEEEKYRTVQKDSMQIEPEDVTEWE